MVAQQALTAALGVIKSCFNLGCDQIQSSWTPAAGVLQLLWTKFISNQWAQV